jgi:hypothetical protein
MKTTKKMALLAAFTSMPSFSNLPNVTLPSTGVVQDVVQQPHSTTVGTLDQTLTMYDITGAHGGSPADMGNFNTVGSTASAGNSGDARLNSFNFNKLASTHENSSANNVNSAIMSNASSQGVSTIGQPQGFVVNPAASNGNLLNRIPAGRSVLTLGNNPSISGVFNTAI